MSRKLTWMPGQRDMHKWDLCCFALYRFLSGTQINLNLNGCKGLGVGTSMLCDRWRSLLKGAP